jgi:hypothetical protein
MTENSNENITFYISIITSSLLAISEILPYIKVIKSNGIIECFLQIFKTLIGQQYIQLPQNANSINYENNINLSNNLQNSLVDLTNELKSFKDIFQNYLNNKKINIDIT